MTIRLPTATRAAALTALTFICLNVGATNLNVGDNVFCNGTWEGHVSELVARNSVTVQVHSSYIYSRFRNENVSSTFHADFCVKQLPDSALIGPEGLGLGDEVACGAWRGKIKSVFDKNYAKVHFTESSKRGYPQGENILTILDIGHCQRLGR